MYMVLKKVMLFRDRQRAKRLSKKSKKNEKGVSFCTPGTLCVLFFLALFPFALPFPFPLLGTFLPCMERPDLVLILVLTLASSLVFTLNFTLVYPCVPVLCCSFAVVTF